MLRRVVACVLALGACIRGSAGGQELPVGAHIRLSGPALASLEGSLRSVRGDTIFLDVRQFLAPFAIPVARVSRFEVLESRHRHTKVGANIGAAAGLAIGFATTAKILHDGCRTRPGGDALDTLVTATGCTFAVFMAPAYGMALGYGVGALVGHFVVTETWISVPADRIRVALMPRGDGLGIGVTLPF